MSYVIYNSKNTFYLYFGKKIELSLKDLKTIHTTSNKQQATSNIPNLTNKQKI